MYFTNTRGAKFWYQQKLWKYYLIYWNC